MKRDAQHAGERRDGVGGLSRVSLIDWWSAVDAAVMAP